MYKVSRHVVLKCSKIEHQTNVYKKTNTSREFVQILPSYYSCPFGDSFAADGFYFDSAIVCDDVRISQCSAFVSDVKEEFFGIERE